MKTININKIALLLICLVVFTACVQDDDFDTPNTVLEEPNLEVQAITIDALISLYEQEFNGFIDDLGLDINSDDDDVQEAIANLREDYVISLENTDNYLSGIVISSDEAGNFFEEMIIQNRADQGTAGVRVMIDVNPLFGRYRVGQLIYVRLFELHFGVSNGVLTLGISEDLEKIPSFSEEDFIKRSPQISPIVPTEIEFADFDDSLENVFVKLNNVQFNRNLVLNDNETTFAGEPQDEFDGERNLESCDQPGATIILSTSTFADFKSLSLPSGQGSINGILTRNFFGDTFNLAINSPEDINFSGEENRCDPDFFECTEPSGGGVTIFEEDFEGFGTFASEGWTNINVSGTSTDWFISGFNNNDYARISAFSSGNAETDVWLVTPSIDLSMTNGEELSFEIEAAFDNGTILTVLISDDFTGDVTTATWQILDANVTVGPNPGFSGLQPKGPLNIACLDGTINVAFFYEGGDPGATTRYHVDNVVVTGN
ncbi:MAG: DUF5689 domain-containing protein [Psychroserpens sp.]|uniref:DUF5689 domain-containing protein n=1 Tax=Psychroserpens sp. TaxID=2020870 RepID=UPI003C73EFD8